MYCLSPLLAWGPNKSGIRFSLIIKQSKAQSRNNEWSPALCKEHRPWTVLQEEPDPPLGIGTCFPFLPEAKVAFLF